MLTSTEVAAASEIPLTTREALSGIFGSISLACWLFLLLPQLLENYRNSSAEAISLAFIFVWFIGDVANLAGAIWAGLVPVITAIAVYFCIADGVLIGQCLYYGIKNKRKQGKALLSARPSSAGASSSTAAPDGRVGQQSSGVPDEEEPLLKRANSITIPGSADTRRRSSASARRRRSSVARQDDQLAKILEESDENGAQLWFKNAMSILAIAVVGAAGWAVAYESGAWKPSPTSADDHEEEMALGAEILGYLSAVAYLGARIPQIVKNARDRSCEGMLPSPDFGLFFRPMACGPAILTRILHRSVTLVLHSVPDGQSHLRRGDFVPFDRVDICDEEPAMADWKPGNHGGRRYYFCTVPHV